MSGSGCHGNRAMSHAVSVAYRAWGELSQIKQSLLTGVEEWRVT